MKQKAGKPARGWGRANAITSQGHVVNRDSFFFISRSDNSEEMFSSGGSAARRGAVWARAAGRGGQ